MKTPYEPEFVIGRTFNYLTGIRYQPDERKGHYYLFRCVCGTEKVLPAFNVVKGNTKSCGCMTRSLQGNRKHGKKNTPEYRAWTGMRSRCDCSTNQDYADYGGRGIYVCERWKESFTNFLEDMGPRPSPKHSLDRIDNDGPYSPENCHWADKRQQSENRRNSHLITYDGRTKTIKGWAKEFEMDYLTLWYPVVKAGIPMDVVLHYYRSMHLNAPANP